MVETLNYTETDKAPEYNEQSPEQFIDSLALFDTYADIPEGQEHEPEQQMPFTTHEQELAIGIRGTLTEMAEAAVRDHQKVSIPELFTVFEESLRNTDMDEQTRDELFLVATKMRYHLQIRYDKAQQNEPVPESAPRASTIYEAALLGDEYVREYISSSIKNPRLVDEWLSSARQAADTRAHEWNDWLHERKEQLGDEGLTDHPKESGAQEQPGTEEIHTDEDASSPIESEQAEAEQPKRDYDSEATEIIMNRTKGADFSDLNRKEQGKVTRGLAREYHPDFGGDEELYKAITEQTAAKPTDGANSDTRSY